MSNFAKTDKEGNMYAIYQYEQLSCPAMEDRGHMTDRTCREGFPHRTDQTLSRYAWARAGATWFETVAITREHLLMAKKEDGVIVPDHPWFKTLYIGDVTGTFYIRTDVPFEIISSKRVSVEGTGTVKVTVTD